MAVEDQRPYKYQLHIQNDKLKPSDAYERVHLRSAKSHTDRLIELNFKVLLPEIPGGNDYFVPEVGESRSGSFVVPLPTTLRGPRRESATPSLYGIRSADFSPTTTSPNQSLPDREYHTLSKADWTKSFLLPGTVRDS
ncbi:hypothetical protein Bbelb_084270 [Branchiostoma belcheri]|nr:hypothetical protein Bbelb_084270 [Branchiostoma belcheri]